MKKIASLFLLLLCSCAQKPKPDLLLITVDTLRADRLGSYGHRDARTPFMDGLARDGVRYDQCMTPIPVTLPAHASILSGRLPAEHGVRNNLNYLLSDDVETIAEELQAAGYATGAFVSAFPLAARFGLAQGFDRYDDDMPAGKTVFDFPERDALTTIQAGLRWLRSQPQEQPVFVWVHLFEPHAPYAPPSPLDEEFSDAYDGEVAAVDAALMALGAGFVQVRGAQPITILTADHGEGLGDHGEETHSFFLYESTLRVPLIVHAPGRWQPAVVNEAVTLCDIAPTLRRFAGLSARPSSGVALDRSGMPRRELYAETLYGLEAFGWSPMVARREGSHKLIRSARTRAYDLGADPREQNELGATNPDWVAGARTRTDAEITRWAQLQRNSGRASNAAENEALAALGYISGTAQQSADLLQLMSERPDGTMQLQEFADVTTAQDLIEERNFEAAIPVLEGIREINPRNGFALGLLGGVYNSLGEVEKSLEIYRAASLVDPDRLEHRLNAGRALRALSRHEEAVADYEFALHAVAADINVLHESASYLIAAGHADEVLATLRGRLAVKTGSGVIERADLNALYAVSALEAQRPDEALPYILKARELADSPKLAVVHAQYLRSQRDWDGIRDMLRPLREQLESDDQAQLLLGLAEDQSGHPAEAIEHYRRSLELNERQFVAHSRLATMLLRTGAGDEAALPHAARAVELGPSEAHAHGLYVDILMRLGNVQIARNHVRRFASRFVGNEDFDALFERVGLPRE